MGVTQEGLVWGHWSESPILPSMTVVVVVVAGEGRTISGDRPLTGSVCAVREIFLANCPHVLDDSGNV